MTDRDLSCFFCRELFPLYMEEKLDRIRIQQVEKHLNQCKECPSLLETIKNAKKSLMQLSRTAPSKELVEFLKKKHFFWTDLYAKYGWKQWPSTTQWAVELVAVGLVLAVTIHLFPWLNLARSLKSFKPAIPQARIVVPEEPAVVAKEIVQKPATQVVIGPQWPKDMKSPDEYAKDLEKAKTVALAAAVAEEESAEPQGPSGSEDKAGAAQKEPGVVWRGSLTVDALNDAVADKVTAAIGALGGTKAGQVELGWRRGSDRYYHFILPVENYDKLLSTLNEEGFVNIKKEKHPRVIKEGFMRIIMTIEEEK